MKVIVKNVFYFIFNIAMLTGQLFPDNNLGGKIRGLLLKPFLKRCGKNLSISKSTNILYPQNVEVGDDVFIGYCAWLNAMGGIRIQDEVMIGPFNSISSANHTRLNMSFRHGCHKLSPVVIEKGAWLAAHVSVVPGTHIKSGSLIAAGAIASGVIDSNSLYVGSIAQKKKVYDE